MKRKLFLFILLYLQGTIFAGNWLPSPFWFMSVASRHREPGDFKQDFPSMPLEKNPVNFKNPYGLKNLGNTCYQNAATQALAGSRIIHDAIWNIKEDPSSVTSQTGLFMNLVRKLHGFGNNSTHSRTFAYLIAQRLGSSIERQEDGAAALERIIEYCSVNNTNNNNQQGLGDNFNLYITKKFTCQDTVHNPRWKESAEPEKILSVPITNNCKLEDSIEEFFSPETTSSDNSIDCENCNKKTITKQQLFLTEQPQIIAIALKRFKAEMRNGKVETSKLDTPISIPEHLELANYISEEKKETHFIPITYKLVGIGMHAGSCTSGHYNAYRKFQGAWYFCDDSHVYHVNNEQFNKMLMTGIDQTYKWRTPYFFVYENQQKTWVGKEDYSCDKATPCPKQPKQPKLKFLTARKYW